MRLGSRLSRLLLPTALIAIAVVAQASQLAPGEEQQPAAERSVPMMPLPANLSRRCRSASVLRPACPRLIPKVPDQFNVSGPTHLSAGFTVLDIEHGAPHDRQPRFNRPPAVLHLTIVAGPRPSNLFAAMPYPGSKKTATLRNGLDTGRNRKPLLFGLRRWGRHTGALFLAPGYPLGGQISGHLTFWWRQHGQGYVISLHAWEPLTETARVLRTIVTSTP